jgi:tryptophan synthase alpha chain
MMTGRMERTFSRLREKGEKALIFYVTAGDPDLKTTETLIPALAAAGVDILEIGVPFSDPTADGPVIQASSRRALQGGATLANILDLIEKVRRISEIPILLFGYYNPIFIYGNETFARKAKAAGVDGILVVDLPPEESAELRTYTDPAGIDFISLIAPTSSDQRIRRITENAVGFLYYISITGVTGAARPEIEDIRRDVERIRKLSSLPVVVGFGISTPQQAGEIARLADGVVIGSAVVKRMAENAGRDHLVQIVTSFAGEIKKAIQIGSKT